MVGWLYQFSWYMGESFQDFEAYFPEKVVQHQNDELG